jgi:hypothetical protein
VGAYTPEQRSEFEEALAWSDSQVQSVSVVARDVYCVYFEKAGEPFVAYCNLNKAPVSVGAIKNGGIAIQPFETLILKAN